MSDIADRAQQREAEFLADALAGQARAARLGDPSAWKSTAAKWCEAEGCGERIPDARRRAVPNVRLCVECQALHEQGRL